MDNLANQFGLSGSKLNKRYQQQNGSQDQEENGKWEDLGLSTKTSLNDRYFSQPDLLSNRQGRFWYSPERK